MASSLLALIDDIASILDDVAVLGKVAAKKTSGVLGDDLALNAQQVSGVKAERELPVVWAVFKGSLINKAILVPSAMLISAILPAAITPLLMLGGLFLCYEGFEKLAHKLLQDTSQDAAHHAELVQALADSKKDVVALEKEKIKGAVRTDFILSAEIIAITLGTVQSNGLSTQFAVLASVAIAMTIGVYGLVAGIVKLDDFGLYLVQENRDGSNTRWQQSLGRGILVFAPYMMKTLSVVGTAAMFLVGGGILTHGLPILHHWIADAAQGLNDWQQTALGLGADVVTGILAGAVVVVVVKIASKLWKTLRPKAPNETVPNK